MSDFYKYFKENMDGLGLPAPESLFGSLQAAVANANVLLGSIDKFGKRVTIREIIGAGTRLEALSAVAGCAAAFYVGAVIGSIAVATGRSLTGGTSISDVLATAKKYGLARPWLTTNIRRWPAIYNSALASKNAHRQYASIV